MTEQIVQVEMLASVQEQIMNTGGGWVDMGIGKMCGSVWE